MQGVFCKTKGFKIYNIVGIVSGLFLVGLFGALLCAGVYETLDNVLISVFFCIFGTLVAAFCGLSMFVNRKAFIRVDEEKISAYCHFGLHLECGLAEVAAVSCTPYGLNIKLKNGKNYNLVNLENGYDLRRYIQKRILKEQVRLDREETIRQIVPLKKKRKMEAIASVCTFLLIFPCIIVAAWLTGWRDLHEFSTKDWTLFAMMGGVGVAIIIIFCIVLRRYIHHTDTVQKLAGTLYQQMLRTTPAGPGNALRMYVDDEEYASLRVTVYGFPNEEDVYFTVEDVDANYELQRLHTSEIYPNMQAMEEELMDLTEIPLP